MLIVRLLVSWIEILSSVPDRIAAISGSFKGTLTMHRITLGRSIVDFELDRLGQADAERELDQQYGCLGVGSNAGGELCHELFVVAIDHLLDRAAVQGLAVADAFDPPGRRRGVLRQRGWRQAKRGTGQHKA